MIRRIQALNYRCLRYVDIVLDRFHVLVGPNASGKSTLLDVVAFLGDMVSEGLEEAVEKRTRNFQDLVWKRPASCWLREQNLWPASLAKPPGTEESRGAGHPP